MGLQPHAQREIDEKIKLWMNFFKAGYEVARKHRGDLPSVEFEDFIEFMKEHNPIIGDYIKQELW